MKIYNPETRKAWYQRNKEQRRANGRKWYAEHRAQEAERKRKYRLANPEMFAKKSSEFYKKNHLNIVAKRKLYREKLREQNRYCGRSCLDGWLGVIPAMTQCQCCGKDIFFASGKQSTSINFDHRRGGTELIKDNPTSWLRNHKRTQLNESIWRSCDFGMLCYRCNMVLPTEDRKLFLKNISDYIESFELGL